MRLVTSSPTTNSGKSGGAGLQEMAEVLLFGPMKFALAIAVFGLFAFFISWGILLMMHGQPWLLLAALGLFLGTFIKFGCQSH